MTWGLTVGVIVIMVLFAFFGFVIFKEARTQRFWRRKVEEGDLEMIEQLVRMEVQRWRAERSPKGTPAAIWQGVQGVEVIEIGREHVHVSTTAEPQFALVGGKRQRVSGAVDGARLIVALLGERFFYDIPHVRLQRVQMDVYTTFHDPDGSATQRCILSVAARREDAATIDWDEDGPEAIAAVLGARFDVDPRGVEQPIEPVASRPGTNGTRSDEGGS